MLVSSGYEEETTIPAFMQIKRNGFEINFVSPFSGRIIGKNGIEILNYTTLSQAKKTIISDHEICLLMIAGGHECVHHILADPRSHLLINDVLNTNGVVCGLYPSTQSLLSDLVYSSDLKKRSNLWFQDLMDTSEFISNLLIHLNKQQL